MRGGGNHFSQLSTRVGNLTLEAAEQHESNKRVADQNAAKQRTEAAKKDAHARLASMKAKFNTAVNAETKKQRDANYLEKFRQNLTDRAAARIERNKQERNIEKMRLMQTAASTSNA